MSPIKIFFKPRILYFKFKFILIIFFLNYCSEKLWFNLIMNISRQINFNRKSKFGKISNDVFLKKYA